MIDHIHITVCARDNVTIRAAGIDCMDWVSRVADETNAMLEIKRDSIATAMADIAVFGNAFLPL